MYGPVVVGFDDSEHSAHAVAAAVREAQTRAVPLWMVHAYQWISPVAFGTAAGIEAEDAARDQAVALLDKAAGQVRDEHPDLVVQTVPAGGHAAQLLVEACPVPSLVVVGGRGHGGFSGLTLGSVALRVLSHSHVPVMVVRGEPRARTGRLMLGVDLDVPPTGLEVVEFAFDEADRRGADLCAINAWEDPTYLYHPVAAQFAQDVVARTQAVFCDRMDSQLGPSSKQHPTVGYTRQVLVGSPAGVLIESSQLADAVVLGGRLRAAGHEGMRIGAVAHTVLRHAHCPVIIVPEHWH